MNFCQIVNYLANQLMGISSLHGVHTSLQSINCSTDTHLFLEESTTPFLTNLSYSKIISPSIVHVLIRNHIEFKCRIQNVKQHVILFSLT